MADVLQLPSSFPDHVRRALESEIIEGRLAPGKRVSEDGLARRLGVSRTPVREAMRVLEGQGLIVRRHGTGTYVAELTTFDEARVIYELRLPLEGYLAERAAELVTDEELRALALLQQDFRRVLGRARNANTLRELIAADASFHWAIYEAARTDLASILRSYWGRVQRELYHRAYGRDDLSEFGDQHEAIAAALEQGDPDAAHSAMAAHIESGWEAVRSSFETPVPPAA
ncbi:MAG: GntR family transcriptional regulator [Gaiellaceae bacterium]